MKKSVPFSSVAPGDLVYVGVNLWCRAKSGPYLIRGNEVLEAEPTDTVEALVQPRDWQFFDNFSWITDGVNKYLKVSHGLIKHPQGYQEVDIGYSKYYLTEAP